MNIYGVPWSLMAFRDHILCSIITILCSMITFNVPWSPLMFHDHLMGSMITYGVQWIPKVFHHHLWCSMITCGVPWSSIVFHGHLLWSTITYGVSWSPMVFHDQHTIVFHDHYGFLLSHKVLHDHLLYSMISTLWCSVITHGVPWSSMVFPCYISQMKIFHLEPILHNQIKAWALDATG